MAQASGAIVTYSSGQAGQMHNCRHLFVDSRVVVRGATAFSSKGILFRPDRKAGSLLHEPTGCDGMKDVKNTNIAIVQQQPEIA